MAKDSKMGQALMKLSEALELVAQRLATILYREIFKRNTIWPMKEIIQARPKERQVRLLREWAQTKSHESSYIQLAGGFLFTTASSCLQWPGTQNGHWSAAALFYCSILLSLVAIVSGSQQLLVLPRGQRYRDRAQPLSASGVPLQPEEGNETGDEREYDSESEETAYLEKVVEVMCIRWRKDRPNNLQVFALQTPLMLLSLAVVMYLAGMCSVIFAPLARNLAWDDDAKDAQTAVMFGSVGVFCIGLFFCTSQIMHGMFSRDNQGPWLGTQMARMPT